MSDEKQQTEEKDELRDLDVLDEHREGRGPSPRRPPPGLTHRHAAARDGHLVVAGRAFARSFDLKEEVMTDKHETLVRSGRLINHNETLVRSVLSVNHSETLVLHDLDLPEAEAEHVKGGAFRDIKGESQDDEHAAQIEVISWEWGLK
jgi:hypothetical protein